MFGSRSLQVLLLLTCAVTAVLAGCASPPPPAPPPPPPKIEVDRCGHNTRNPMNLPPEIAVSIAINDPTSYAHMIMDYYDKHPECRL